MTYYFGLLKVFFITSAMTQMAYRPSFIFAIFGKVTRMFLTFAVYYTIFLHTDTIHQWAFNDVLLLVVIYFTIEYLVVITFFRNLLYYLPDMIRKGTFDFLLIKPASTIFITAFRVIDIFDFFASLPLIALWIYVVQRLSLTWQDGVIILLSGTLAFVFLFSLTLMVSSFAFRIVLGTGLGRLFEQVLRVARFPTDIYPAPFTFVLSFILPMAAVATLPATIVQFGGINTVHILGTFLAVCGVTLLSFAIWKMNLKAYTSASS